MERYKIGAAITGTLAKIPSFVAVCSRNGPNEPQATGPSFPAPMMSGATTVHPCFTRAHDYIGFIIGASQPVLAHDGSEFGYERQLPKTDTTVDDIYYRGALGTGKIEGRARMRRWAVHRIEVEGDTIRWFQDGTKLREGRVPSLNSGGYFGIRQRYERGTRYDDVRISLTRFEAP